MKLSKQAQLCMVGVFQKGLLGITPANELLDKLEFIIYNNELNVVNAEICQVTQEDIESLGLELGSEVINA